MSQETVYDKFMTILNSLELNYHVEITKTGRVTCVLCTSAFSLGLDMLDHCIHLSMSTSWLFDLNTYIESRNGNIYVCFPHENLSGAKV